MRDVHVLVVVVVDSPPVAALAVIAAGGGVWFGEPVAHVAHVATQVEVVPLTPGIPVAAPRRTHYAQGQDCKGERRSGADARRTSPRARLSHGIAGWGWRGTQLAKGVTMGNRWKREMGPERNAARPAATW